MTSRNLFFKLMREDLKRKIWAFSLAFLSFFFWMPVNAAMSISNLQQTYQRWLVNGTTFGEGITAESRYAEKLLGIVETTIGLENPLNIMTMAVAAIVMALTGFMYLHSRKQVDFYHSIPVKRELLFAVKYLNGILIVVSMYLINMMFAMGILAINGIEFSVLLPAGLIACAVHAGGFFVNYGLMVIAVILTGNFFISILGGMVLFAYIPAVIALAQGLMYLFFETINLRGVSMEQMMVNGSPISYYINLVVKGAGMDLAKYGHLMDSVGIMAAAGAVMTVIALFLYKKRPSESAGKAMAFTITKAPIKILLVVPITIAASILFWNIYYSLPWAVFGFVVGLVVTHAIIEIIYHFEFSKLFANLPHMACSAVLALAVIGIFRFDLIGYDRYKPAEKEFESASIYAQNLRDGVDYGLPFRLEQGSGYHQSWRYMSMDQYVIDHMKFTDYEVISTLADAGILVAEQTKEAKYANLDYVDSPGFWTSLEIGYKLTNGKTVYRNYRVNVTELREIFDRMYENPEYKKGTVPVLSYNMDNITGIYESRDNKIHEVEANAALQAQILDAYKEEMSALTLEERAQVSPVTSLRFLTIAEHDYISSISHDRNPNFTGDFRLEDMNKVNFFPVYPSFTKTLALLAQAGVDDLGPVDVDDVLRIEIVGDYYVDEKAYYDAPVHYYEEQVQVYSVSGMHSAETIAYPVTVASEDGIRTITLEDDGTKESAACMDQVLAVIVHQDLMHMNGLQPREHGISVRLYMKEANEGRTVNNQEFFAYSFPADKIPQFVKDAYDYDDRLSKNVSYGLNIPIEN